MRTLAAVIGGLFFWALIVPASAKVQCSCPNVPADGEGNSSCSASESHNRCTLDFNLFGKESEDRAAELLRKYGVKKIVRADSSFNAVENLRQLAYSKSDDIPSLVALYLIVAAGDYYARAPGALPADGMKEIIASVESPAVSRALIEAFQASSMKTWDIVSDAELRRQRPAVEKAMNTRRIGHTTVSHGCIEVATKSGLWVMFKAAWSPSRIFEDCGGRDRRRRLDR